MLPISRSFIVDNQITTPVSTSANGLPLTPDGYVVLYNQSPENIPDNYYYLGYSTGLQHTHYRITRHLG